MGDELGSCEIVIARKFDGCGSRLDKLCWVLDKLCWDGARVLGSCKMLGWLKLGAEV